MYESENITILAVGSVLMFYISVRNRRICSLARFPEMFTSKHLSLFSEIKRLHVTCQSNSVLETGPLEGKRDSAISCCRNAPLQL